MKKAGLASIPVLVLAIFSSCAKSTVPTALASAPAEPQINSVAISSVSPPSGTTIVIPPQYPYNQIGGVVLPAGSGVISVSGSLRLAHDTAYCQLNIYLLTGSGEAYSGQNLPDTPTWTDLKSGWSTTFTITGWQIYSLPNDVTGVRVMFHKRNSGLLTPPSESETLAEATFPVNWQIRR